MAETIQPQLIITEFVVKGEEDIKRMKVLQDSIDKKTSVNIDTSKAQKSIFDFSKSLENIKDKQLVGLRKAFLEVEKQGAFKNIDKKNLELFAKQIEKSTSAVQILDKTVKFFKDNISKLNLKPEELAGFNKELQYGEKFLRVLGNETDNVGKKNVSLRGKLAAVRNELTLLDQAGKSNTQTYRQLQVEAGKLQDEIDDNRAAVKALSSDTLGLDAGIGAIRGLVAGFTAYSGALAIAGVDTKEFEKTLLQVNGAMAVLQGLQEITNLLQAQSAVRLVATTAATNLWNFSMLASNSLLKEGTVVANLFGNSIGGLRKAFAATGIGLLLVFLGYLVTTIIEVAKEARGATKSWEEFTKALKDNGAALADRIKATQQFQELSEKGYAQQRREIDLLKEKNTALDVIQSKEKALLNQEISDAEQRLAKLNVFLTKSFNDESVPFAKRLGQLIKDGLSPEVQAAITEQANLIREKRIEIEKLDVQFNRERKERALDFRELEAKLNNEATGLFGNELTERIKLAQVAYEKDLLAFAGTESEKRKFKRISEQQLAKEIEKIRREIESKPFDPLVTTTELSTKQRQLIDKQASSIANDLVNSIESNLEKPLPPSVRAAYESLLKDLLTGENVQGKIDEALKKDLENIFKNLPKVVKEETDKAKAKTPPVSLGELIFGNLTDAEKTNAKYFDQFLSQSLAFLNAQTQAQIDADNRAIESQENKVNRFRDLAEFGTAEQLDIEQKRLEQLQRKREEDVQKQRQLAAVQLAINNAVTASETIKAVAKAFGEGNLLTGILTSAALVATIFSTISSVSNAFSSLPSFDKGTDRFGKGNIDRKGGSLAILHPDEAVLKPEHNKAMDYAPNHKKVELYLLGKQARDGFRMPDFARSLPSSGYSSEDREIKPLLKEVLRELKGSKSRVVANMNIDKKGFVSIVTEEMQRKERKEKSR